MTISENMSIICLVFDVLNHVLKKAYKLQRNNISFQIIQMMTLFKSFIQYFFKHEFSEE